MDEGVAVMHGVVGTARWSLLSVANKFVRLTHA